jgi:glucose-6-phosphate 1-dehydrogenase
VPSYLETDNVDPESETPTYAAVRVNIDSWRWQGVPFYLRTGKAMERRITQVAVTFRPPPVCLFHAVPDDCSAFSDVLYLTLQPDEGFHLEIEVKEPGASASVRTIPLHFRYEEEFGEIPDAYETLLGDIMTGDQTLFVHADEVEESWRLYTPVLHDDLPVHRYPAGSWGPDRAEDLLDGAGWAVGG